MKFADAIDDALAQAMAADPTIVILGEDVQALRRNLLVRFGEQRVRNAPISEGAFVGAAVAAAMAGLRPVVEVMLIDFVTVALDAIVNHAAKVETFSGGRWRVPLVVRSACGGGYGDAGQHEQSLWGWLAHIPGLTVLVPSNPADAGGLMTAALAAGGPVIYLEHKLLSEPWLQTMGSGGRSTVSFDVPAAGARGKVPARWKPLPIGQAELLREGRDIGLVSVGVGVHRCLAAARTLHDQGFSAAVLDLRTVCPLDRDALGRLAAATGRLLVVDEDYKGFGLSGEIAAVLLEQGFAGKYGRVCTEQAIPYARTLEDEVLPGTVRIVRESLRLLG
jgi:pyruvate/2-oxoglutarate/acetoin dehydrogenase E1 component